MATTIRDVARESGVSVATVSYVLNNGPRSVRPQTRDRVLAAMRRLEYHPNAMARGLVSRRLHTIGVLFGQIETSIITNPYAAAVIQGILSAAADLGYNVTLFPQPWQDAQTSAAPFKDRRTDGVVLVAPLTGSDMVTSLARLKLPLVVVSAPSPVPGIPSVDVDNTDAAAAAVEHLVALGHRKIGHVGGDPRHASVGARREGYERVLQAAGIPLRPEHVVYADYGGWDVPEKVIPLLRSPDRPTALFVGNDFMAFRVYEAARELGLRIPEDLSVVGFDDVPSAALVSPPLTTMRQPLALLGQEATRILVRQINAGETGIGDFVRYEGQAQLMVRSSTAVPLHPGA